MPPLKTRPVHCPTDCYNMWIQRQCQKTPPHHHHHLSREARNLDLYVTFQLLRHVHTPTPPKKKHNCDWIWPLDYWYPTPLVIYTFLEGKDVPLMTATFKELTVSGSDHFAVADLHHTSFCCCFSLDHIRQESDLVKTEKPKKHP